MVGIVYGQIHVGMAFGTLSQKHLVSISLKLTWNQILNTISKGLLSGLVIIAAVILLSGTILLFGSILILVSHHRKTTLT